MIPKIKLNNGVEIPLLGFGPGGIGYSPHPKPIHTGMLNIYNRVYNKFIGRKLLCDGYIDAVSNALKIGYTLLDDSDTYNNFSQIKKAIYKAGVRRKNIFITSRVDNRAQFNGNVREAFFETLRQLDTDYLDMYQFHWPVTDCYINTWKEMVKLYKEGYIKVLGVANCKEHHLKEIMDASDIIPSVNQFEVHPLFTQKKLIAFCKSYNIQVESYTPLARSDDRLVRLPKLRNIAAKHNKTIVQVILRWHIQNGLIPVTRSLNKKRQAENIDIFDFELTSEEMETIDGININSRLRYDPDNCDFSIL